MAGIIAGAAIAAAAAIGGGIMSRNSQSAMGERNIEAQERWAQNAIRWRVEDAKRAGVHPLYAMGAPSISFRPVQTGSPMGGSIADAGQNIGNALARIQTREDREQDARERAQKTRLFDQANLQNVRGQNSLLQAQTQYYQARIRNMTQQGAGMPGLGDDKPGGSKVATLSKDLEVAGQGEGGKPTGGQLVLTNPYGYDFHLPAGTMTAEEWQKYYGEPGDWLGGGINLMKSLKFMQRDLLNKQRKHAREKTSRSRAELEKARKRYIKKIEEAQRKKYGNKRSHSRDLHYFNRRGPY